MNNIFNWAKKELSLDAVVACVLDEKDNTSKELIKVLTKKKAGNGGNIPANYTIESVNTQGEKIDVFVELKDVANEAMHALIIEDKVDTFLHSNQLLKYIRKTHDAKKYAGIHFVLLKTGNVYFWERDEYFGQAIEVEKQFQDATCYYCWNKRFADFFDKGPHNYSWLNEYKAYKKNELQINNNNRSWMHDLSTDKQTFIETLLGQKNHKKYKKWIEFSKPDGGGKRNYELWIGGICGRSAKDKKDDSNLKNDSLKDLYYLFPVIKFDDAKIEIHLHFHLYANKKHHHGYRAHRDLKIFLNPKVVDMEFQNMKRKLALELRNKNLQNSGWKIITDTQIKENSLWLCKKTIDLPNKNTGPQNCPNVIAEIQEIIAVAEDLEKTIKGTTP